MRKVLLLCCGAALLLVGSWAALYAGYHSRHPCDWLLQETVHRVLQQRGIDPDTASIPLKASVVGSAEVQTVLRLRSTAVQCLSTWAGARISRGLD
ncbi:MAG: hypothetical protein KY464_01510 [Gemmatimonadetes bacterium]|nr:hypothetical protein [Gemmatimonadota bacterium]